MSNIEQAAEEAAKADGILSGPPLAYFTSGFIAASTASQGLKWIKASEHPPMSVFSDTKHYRVDNKKVDWGRFYTGVGKLPTFQYHNGDEYINLYESDFNRIEYLDESTPTDDRAEPDYPTYEQAGGNKTWDDMTELEKAYYDIRKLRNALAIGKNHIQSLRKKADDRAAHAMAFAEWKTKEGWYLRSDSNTWKNDNFDLSYSIDDVYALWPDRDKAAEGPGKEAIAVLSKEEILENWFGVSEYDFTNAEITRLTAAMQEYADQQTARLSADLETAKRGLEEIRDGECSPFARSAAYQTLKQLS